MNKSISLIKSTSLLVLSVLSQACAGTFTAGDDSSDRVYTYTHTIDGDGAGCAVIRADEHVSLRCTDDGPLVAECPHVAEHTAVEVFAPAGVTPSDAASHVTLDTIACTAPETVYSLDHMLEGLPECGMVRSTAPDLVRLQCGQGETLTDACLLGAKGQTVGVYAAPGAGNGQPFGVSSLVVLEGCPL